MAKEKNGKKDGENNIRNQRQQAERGRDYVNHDEPGSEAVLKFGDAGEENSGPIKSFQELASANIQVRDFEKEDKGLSSKVVAMEGVDFPFYGCAYRPDKVMYIHDDPKIDEIDHSSAARTHAQLIGNFIVDEAKMSSNKYPEKSDLLKELVSNLDIKTLDFQEGFEREIFILP